MAWTTVSDAINARRVMGSCGTLESGLLCGGLGDVPKDWTETWNGAVWSSADEITYARKELAAAGGASAAVCFGGANSSNLALAITESYEPDLWSDENAMNVYRRNISGAGDASDALAVCGTNSAGTKLATTEKWDGTNWSSDASLSEAKEQVGTCGTINGALAAGGRTGTVAIYTTETYNGTAWSTGNDLNTARRVSGIGGDNNNALIFLGINSAGANLSSCEKWNGTSWATVSALSVARHGPGGFGDISGAIAVAGYTTVNVKTTEKWLNSRLAGIVADKVGTTITSVVCNIDIYDASSRGTRIGTAVSSADNGIWFTNSVAKAVDEKVLAMFTYEGTYKGDTDIAGAEFITTTSAQ